jgi:Fic family protein
MLYRHPDLMDIDWQVLDKIGDLRKRLGFATSEPRRWTGLLRRNAFARAIQGSNSIEGYNVTVEDAIAAAEGDEPLEADREAWLAVSGYRRAMTYVLNLASDNHFAYSPGLLRSLHFMMVEHDLSKNPGKWRPGGIYVRREPAGEVVYEGPGWDLVPSLMDELVEWLNAAKKIPALVSAAMAHLNLVMVHPFSDGNGRMARCLQTLVLARDGILAPQFSSIEEYLGRNTTDYYNVLAEVGRGQWHPENDPLPWVRFALTAHFRQASTLLRRHREMHRLWDAIEFEVLGRGLPDRTLLALADAAYGHRVRNSTYRNAAEISNNLASRDLKALVDQGLLLPRGERRGRHYVAAPRLQQVRQANRENRVTEDPYSPVDFTHRQPRLL